jgi:molybdenum cofactor cytidylyltransferase
MPPERAGPVAGIILAAGTSSRMGVNKMLLRLDGETLLRRTVSRAAAAALDPIIVVLGHQADRARVELSDLACEAVLNPDYALGINVSLQVGLAAVPSQCVAAVVILADMPFVTASMIATLVERYRESSAPLVISDYSGVNAPPMLYGRSLFPELREMKGEGCGKQVVKQHRSEALAIPWPAAALIDIDAPADYERVKTELEG